MCGISGCLDKNNDAMRAIMQALNKLQNRGYDSAGICTIDNNNNIIIRKSVSGSDGNAMQNINIDPLSSIQCELAIGHTRWATHGAKTLENAHPHYDDNKRFSIVHNGIIENYVDLKKELMKNGYQFYGQTDTEIVVKYLDFLIKNGKSYADLDKIMEGSWAILVLDRLHPDKIFFMKNGSPLIIGTNENKSKIMFVSELIGFDTDIDNYFIISDKDYGYVCMKENICDIVTEKTYKLIPMIKSDSVLSPAPYKHWTLKEINDQPIALSNLITDRITCHNFIDHFEYNLNFPELDKIKNDINNMEHLVLLACGTSYHAAQIGIKFFKEFKTNITIEAIDGADFEEMDLPQNKKIMLILLSQSGETKDLYRALQIGKNNNIKSIGIINVENSLIAREVDSCLYLKAGREHAVASTKSFTNQIIMLLLLAIWLISDIEPNLKKKYLDAVIKLPTDFYNIIEKSSDEIPKMVDYFKNQTDCFILGKQSCEWIAKEGSLKIKEISYIHSEGFSTAALKHGPFALLTNNIPVIFLANNDKFFPKIENVTAEVKSRNANVVYITNKMVYSDNIDHLFFFDTDSILFPVMTIVPLQFLAYYLALEKGNHPDYPRNLAKVVTVE